MPNGRQLWNQRDNKGIGDTHSIATEFIGDFGRHFARRNHIWLLELTLLAPLLLLKTNTCLVHNFSLICCLIRFKPTKTVGSKEPRDNRTIHRHQITAVWRPNHQVKTWENPQDNSLLYLHASLQIPPGDCVQGTSLNRRWLLKWRYLPTQKWRRDDGNGRRRVMVMIKMMIFKMMTDVDGDDW